MYKNICTLTLGAFILCSCSFPLSQPERISNTSAVSSSVEPQSKNIDPSEEVANKLAKASASQIDDQYLGDVEYILDFYSKLEECSIYDNELRNICFQEAYNLSTKRVDFDTFKSWYQDAKSIKINGFPATDLNMEFFGPHGGGEYVPPTQEQQEAYIKDIHQKLPRRGNKPGEYIFTAEITNTDNSKLLRLVHMGIQTHPDGTRSMRLSQVKEIQ